MILTLSPLDCSQEAFQEHHSIVMGILGKAMKKVPGEDHKEEQPIGASFFLPQVGPTLIMSRRHLMFAKLNATHLASPRMMAKTVLNCC